MVVKVPFRVQDCSERCINHLFQADMKRLLVTGSLGYIGSVLTTYLNESGFDCIGYDTGFFRDCLLYAPSPMEACLRDARDIAEADLKNVDVVVHLAGISNDAMGKLDVSSIYDPTLAYSLGIARLCRKQGVRFIFASSCSVYGFGEEELLTELSSTQPQTPYSLNKLQIEEGLRSISDKDFSPIALRFATVFGCSPRLRFDVVVNMLTGMAVANGTVVLNSDGTSWRPNIHILDVCQAIRRAIELDYRGGELLVLNVGDESNNLQVIEIARIVQRAIPGSEVKFLAANPELDREGLIGDRKVKGGSDTRSYKVSFDKIRKTLPGFTCEWTVAQGVEEMVARFHELRFDLAMFKRRGFYRLQQLEYLYEEGYLSDDLRWLRPRPE
jgi:nucleoside-diphosphate-sugar epimerase